MSLEGTLARVQVLSRDVADRAYHAAAEGKDVAWKDVGNFAKGIAHEAAIICDSAGNLGGTDSNRYLGEFVMGAKNLADNANRLLQALYSQQRNGQEVDLRDIAGARAAAPLTAKGESVVDLFLRMHNPNGDVVKLRHKKGHGLGHALNDLYSAIGTNVDVGTWGERNAEGYLDMACEILQTINESDSAHFSGQKNAGAIGTLKQRAANWKKKHQLPLIVGLSGALVASGVMGTLGYQSMTAKNRQIYEGEEVRKIVRAAHISNLAVLGFEYDDAIFCDVLSNMHERTSKIGDDLENCLNTYRSFGGALREPLREEYASFVEQNNNLNKQILDLRRRIKNREYSQQIEPIHSISEMLLQERMIRERYEALNAKIGSNRYNSPAIVYDK